MNTLKIFSILVIGIIGFSITVFISYKTFSRKNTKNPTDFLIKLASIFISSSILLNLTFNKISKLYDIIDNSSFNFIKIITISKTNYGVSPEMFKMVFLYLGVLFLFIFFFSSLSRIIVKKLIPENLNPEIMQGIILLTLTISFYPLIEQILNSFY